MDIRSLLRITTLNDGSFERNKEIAECYINDGQVHVAIATESNITRSKLKGTAMRNFSLTNHYCRRGDCAERGGVGGVLISVNGSVL